MANCAECVHVEVCKDYINAVLGDVDESQMCGDDCEFYKDRSRFVELPCKVGDTIYWNLLGKTVEDEIMSITIYKNVIRVSLGKGISFDIEDIGRMLFLSREEAEQELTSVKKMLDREMTPSEAIIILDRLNTEEWIDVDRDELRAAVKVAKTALREQIPVKTLPPDIIMGIFNPTNFKCPTCKNTFPEEYATPFCGQCGQALDWGEI